MIRDYVLKRHAGNRYFAVIFATLLIGILAAAIYSQEIKPEISEALEAGDTTLAIELLDKDIAFDKANPWNYYTKGMIFFERGQFAVTLILWF